VSQLTFPMLEPLFFPFAGFCKRNLLDARVIVTTSFENPCQAAVLTGSRLTLSPRRCKRFTKYRCNWSL
jgi:hypothetical protein